MCGLACQHSALGIKADLQYRSMLKAIIADITIPMAAIRSHDPLVWIDCEVFT